MDNIYLEQFEKFGGRRNLVYDRTMMVRHYAWAVPTQEALDAITKYSPIIEIGAGAGYWAALLRAQHCEVQAFDHKPILENKYTNGQTWTPISHGEADEAGKYPAHALFLCWPCYDNDQASRSLISHRNSGGQILIYVGESQHGCTGDKAFHDLIFIWYEIVQQITIPRWEGIHDRLTIYKRRKKHRRKEELWQGC